MNAAEFAVNYKMIKTTLCRKFQNVMENYVHQDFYRNISAVHTKNVNELKDGLSCMMVGCIDINSTVSKV